MRQTHTASRGKILLHYPVSMANVPFIGLPFTYIHNPCRLHARDLVYPTGFPMAALRQYPADICGGLKSLNGDLEVMLSIRNYPPATFNIPL